LPSAAVWQQMMLSPPAAVKIEMAMEKTMISISFDPLHHRLTVVAMDRFDALHAAVMHSRRGMLTAPPNDRNGIEKPPVRDVAGSADSCRVSVPNEAEPSTGREPDIEPERERHDRDVSFGLRDDESAPVSERDRSWRGAMPAATRRGHRLIPVRRMIQTTN
jgi:hypothetical protein